MSFRTIALPAVTIWVDESTEIELAGGKYSLIGYLITNSDKAEFDFMNKLKQARKSRPACWSTLHGVDIQEKDEGKMALIERWLNVFQEDDEVYFHAFLYKVDKTNVAECETYEHYFAKQSIISLAEKMRSSGTPLETMFAKTGTLTVLFDRRRAHAAVVRDDVEKKVIERSNSLENVYASQIKKEIEVKSGKNDKSGFTVRFSFLSSDCFDLMQFTDCLLYMIRHKLSGADDAFTRLFDKHFLSGMDVHTVSLGFEKIYEQDMKFNFVRHD